jgi:hypothetical protein
MLIDKIRKSLNQLRLFTKVEVILILVIISIFIFLIYWGSSSGVRGTDQYWYLADAESLINGQGVQTNNIFPVSVYKEIQSIPRPFVHNILNLYFVILPGIFFGAYTGFIIMNILCSFLTAFFIYKAIIIYTKYQPALLISLLYLLLPVTVWQTAQPLAEASIAPLVALLMLLYAKISISNNNLYNWLILVFISSLLILCRLSFLPIIFVIPIIYLIHNRPIKIKNIFNMVVLFMLGFLFLLIQKNFFESNISIPLLQGIINWNNDKYGNMGNYFDLYPKPITVLNFINVLFTNTIKALKIQFLSLNSMGILFYLPFNLMAIITFILLFKSKYKKIKNIAFISTLFFLLHLLTVILVQNQFRYMLVIIPPLLIVTGIALGNWKRIICFLNKKYVIFILILILILTPINFILANRLHNEGIRNQQVRKELSTVFHENIPTCDPVMVEHSDGRELIYGYILRPRFVLYIRDDYSEEIYCGLAKNVNAKWIICKINSPIIKRMKSFINYKMQKFPEPFESYGLFASEKF